jgi:hypothetical protein
MPFKNLGRQVMAISPADMEKYRKTARRRREVAKMQRLQRLDQAWKVAWQAAQILYQNIFKTRRYLYDRGSTQFICPPMR